LCAGSQLAQHEGECKPGQLRVKRWVVAARGPRARRTVLHDDTFVQGGKVERLERVLDLRAKSGEGYR
jgi:hypothetical protein